MEAIGGVADAFFSFVFSTLNLLPFLFIVTGILLVCVIRNLLYFKNKKIIYVKYKLINPLLEDFLFLIWI